MDREARNLSNMTELVEERGLKVLTIELPERVSGFTCLVQRPKGQPPLPVIVVNNRFSLERRRLTLAHELAHRLIDTDTRSDCSAIALRQVHTRPAFLAPP